MKHKFGKTLKRWRGGLRQKEAADKLGVSLDTYRSWEHGQRQPTENPHLTMAEVLEKMELIKNEK